MIRQTRKQFLETMGLAAVSGLATPARLCQAQTLEPNAAAGTRTSNIDSEAAIPSYLRGYEALYRANPRAAAVEWHRNAKWGLFIHYAFESLRGLTAREALEKKAVSGDEWKKLKGGADVDYTRLRDRFTAAKFDADFITDLALAAEMCYINFTTRHRGNLYMFRTQADGPSQA